MKRIACAAALLIIFSSCTNSASVEKYAFGKRIVHDRATGTLFLIDTSNESCSVPYKDYESIEPYSYFRCPVDGIYPRTFGLDLRE